MPGQADDSASDEGLRGIPAEDAAMAGRKRRRNFQQLPDNDDIIKDESAALSRKGGKSVISAEADESVATLPRITSGGSKSAIDKDELAAPPRKGGKSIIPAMRDEDLSTLPISTLEGSKPTDPGWWGKGCRRPWDRQQCTWVHRRAQPTSIKALC